MKWIDLEKTANDLLSGLDTSNKIPVHFVSTKNKEKKKIEKKKKKKGNQKEESDPMKWNQPLYA